MKKGILVGLLFLATLSMTAKEYHVDCSNPSLGNGSINNPFKTIAQAVKVMKKGDICYIHEGIYRETIITERSGTSNKPITFTRYKNDKVIISATESVSGWVPYKGNVYKTSGVNMPLGYANNVYLNDEKMQIARWPNDTDNNEYSLDAKYIDMTKGTWSMSYISNNEIPKLDWTGGIIHYLGAHSGCSWERTITDYNRDENRIYFETLPDKWPFGKTHSPKRFENGHRGIFYLMNTLEALDAPREWFYNTDKKELYFYAPNGKKPTKNTVEVAVRSHTLKIDSDFIHVKGLNFFGGMIAISGNNNQFSNCMVKHGAERLITNLNGAAVNDAAIRVEGQYNRIQKCVLENGTVNGINLKREASNNLVENNIVQYFNTIGIHAHLINSQGTANKIIKNSLYGSARDGVKVTGDNSEFAFNHVQKCLISGADGGLFYVTGRSVPRNIELHHNWFHDAYADTHAGKKATGIYLDNNAAGYIVHHNVVWDVEWAGLHFNWNAIKNEIYNNTFWNVGIPTEALVSCWVPERNGKQTNVKDNILYNNISDERPWCDSGNGKVYRVDDKEFFGPESDNDFKNNAQFPKTPFVSLQNKNFAPRNDSPIIDKGIIVKGINDNFKGEAPDLGAYEYGGEYWVPGVDWTPEGFAWKPGSDYLGTGSLTVSNSVSFPNVSEPIQITNNDKEHLFASYYGINSFSQNQKYVTVLETDVKNRIPTEEDPAILGLVNLETHKFEPIATTKAWNFQQGCMAHWLGTSPDSLIIYNDLRQDKLVSVILNVHTKKEIKVLDRPVSAVSPDGKKAISLNFSRLSITRKAYGYGGNGQDPQENVQLPKNDGLFLMDLSSGKSKLIVPIDKVKEIIHEFTPEDLVYFNHTLISRDGTKVFWLARTLPSWKTTALTANINGTDIKRCFPDDWGGSHFDWLNGKELMVTTKYNTEQHAHVLFTAGQNDYKRLGKGLLDYDGHGTFSPNAKWMVTDTYPSKNREQKIYLMDMRTEAVLPIGRFQQPKEYTGGWRCDIHCRWSPKGDIIGFNSTHNGSRQVYILKLD
ncbi:right-handed parallel beta-helix repeat-containing protein [Seonamhaeicola marinus]|uniref:Right-handed parallel beta-helix repeat-containing protein n=1 Tax=Seonamhaeicola marinus TaxID=1912246 RepID=A0A5D0I403_9FLAO|nr:right-handed parallel beta-helix repeat-containing protein [Seonamhaeicola marinus]TYA78364.1 right-handed parallel beta-helix repeat-containing protein [Seonamhaeicola marinus]